jgi:serine/threonine-protein kinase RsbW
MLDKSPLIHPTAPGVQPARIPAAPAPAATPTTASTPGAGIQVRLALRLPREDTGAVTVTRRVLDAALAAMGVTNECRSDIALALTEACANAVAHAQLGNDYRVIASTHANLCVIEVADTGVGLDLDRVSAGPPAPTAESGRGLHLIRACTDGMELRAGRPHGLTVRMVKVLAWEESTGLVWA